MSAVGERMKALRVGLEDSAIAPVSFRSLFHGEKRLTLVELWFRYKWFVFLAYHVSACSIGYPFV